MIPKFRAWDKSINFMDDRVRITTIDNNVKVEVLDAFTHWRELEEEQYELMQSTGLKDKNGVEIFEGDMVENTTQKVYLGHKFEVVWNKNYALYQLMNNGLTSNIPLSQDFMSYEVIGNIYENPELLEVE